MLFNFLHLLSLVLWIGTVLFFSGVLTPTLFKSLPRDEASKIVGLLFPLYFKVGLLAGSVALISLIVHSIRVHSFPIARLLVLAIMIGLTVHNVLVVYPRAHTLKEELATTTEETLKPMLQEEFAHAHRYSVTLNGLVLILGLLLLYLTSKTMT
ncbi:MAG: DUF4149 domain-containing protein [Deltaproteobacteria bacterium]|nr:DUF4149 domain-containing protein [Deltaproteobacteria bacterium]